MTKEEAIDFLWRNGTYYALYGNNPPGAVVQIWGDTDFLFDMKDALNAGRIRSNYSGRFSNNHLIVEKQEGKRLLAQLYIRTLEDDKHNKRKYIHNVLVQCKREGT